MVLKNCTRCGIAYTPGSQHLCPACAESDENDFKVVREFIKENPKVSLEVVAEATGVEEDKIREYLKQGRLELADLTGPVLECKRCGKPIYMGEYCVLCRAEFAQPFRSERAGIQQPEKKKQKSFTRRYRDRG